MGASVGGSLVLWLGFSVVASAEIAIFLWQILRALYKWARSRRTNAVQDTCYKGGDTDDTDKQDHPNDVNGWWLRHGMAILSAWLAVVKEIH